FGARADGVALDTPALQAAIDACHTAGGGVVRCGAGVYRTGSIELKSHVELYLGPGCRIVGSADIKDYKILESPGFDHSQANERTAYYLIGARHACQVAITGPGEIDAAGQAFYDQSAPLKKSGQFAVKPDLRPRLAMFHKCTDLRIAEATFRDSPCWTFWLMCCERVQVRGIKIFCDRRIINGDGIDVDACRDITISDCIIHAQDDCLVFRAIQKVHEAPAICENFAVTNCVLSSDRGSIRISCPSDHIVRNGVFSNLTISGPHHGIAMHFPRRFLGKDGRGGADVHDLLFSNISIECGRAPIRMIIEEGIKLTRVSGITFANMRIKSDMPCQLEGSSQTPIEDVTFDNVRIQTSGEQGIILRNCRGIRMNNVELDYLEAANRHA
ncbi:MAG: glycoside hydrolase family 28 protein, partial [Kiritimatiellia bacterium]